jgi:hypothetical protein
VKTAFLTSFAAVVKAMVAPAIEPSATLPIVAAGVLLSILRRREAWSSLWG